MSTTQEQRDQYIIEDYKAGTEVAELARQNGMTARRIQQILSKNGVALRPRILESQRKPISRQHERIGMEITTYLFENDDSITPEKMANLLGWGLPKLRQVQKGVAQLELLDLMDLSSYFGITMRELMVRG